MRKTLGAEKITGKVIEGTFDPADGSFPPQKHSARFGKYARRWSVATVVSSTPRTVQGPSEQLRS